MQCPTLAWHKHPLAMQGETLALPSHTLALLWRTLALLWRTLGAPISESASSPRAMPIHPRKVPAPWRFRAWQQEADWGHRRSQWRGHRRKRGKARR